MNDSNVLKVAAFIDVDAAERAASSTALALELGDAIAEFIDERPELYSTALSIAQIAAAYGILQVGVPKRVAVSEFSKILNAVESTLKRLGDNTRLSEVMAELSLDHTPEKKRRRK